MQEIEAINLMAQVHLLLVYQKCQKEHLFRFTACFNRSRYLAMQNFYCLQCEYFFTWTFSGIRSRYAISSFLQTGQSECTFLGGERKILNDPLTRLPDICSQFHCELVFLEMKTYFYVSLYRHIKPAHNETLASMVLMFIYSAYVVILRRAQNLKKSH